MKIISPIIKTAFCLLLGHSAFAQDSGKKTEQLMVVGDNFIFSVKEPDQWTGDMNTAKDYYAHIIFFKADNPSRDSGALIQVYNFKKLDEQTDKDLAYDTKSYHEKYPSIQETAFPAKHKKYKCYAKLLFIPDSFYQYIVYINPGAKYHTATSISMHIPQRPAQEAELKAFREIIASFTMFKD